MAENNVVEYVTNSPAETMDLGSRFGRALKGGEIVCLIGQLGSGKTHFIKGVAAGLGADDAAEVNSPTFVLVNEYEGDEMRLDVFHIDAYRLELLEEFEMLGFDDMCYKKSVVLVEWADKILPLLENVNYITVELGHISEMERGISIKNFHSAIV